MSWKNHETFTIKIDSRICYLIFQGLELLRISKNFDMEPYSSWLKLNEEAFRNLSNHKVSEVNEVNIINKMSIEVMKREISK